MPDSSTATIAALMLPLLITGGAMLLAQQAAPLMRTAATIRILGTAMLSALSILLLFGDLEVATLRVISLTMLTALLAAAPLVDRTRLPGLIVAACLIGLVVTMVALPTFYRCLPIITRPTLLYGCVIAGALAGLIGSVRLAIHPTRQTTDASIRIYATPQPLILLGGVLSAIALTLLLYLLHGTGIPSSVAVTAITAALLGLLISRNTRAHPSFAIAGDALIAGVLIGGLSPLSAPLSVVAGLGAAWCALQGPTIARALRIDDPLHLVGAWLLPALAALLLQGLLNAQMLAPYLSWLGASVAVGITAGIVVWPLAMLVFGLALPERLVREGVA